MVAVEKVLITGAAGAIGSVLRRGLAGAYPLLRLADKAPLGAAGAGEEVVTADITDLKAMEAAMDGIDAVVHLAAVASEASFDTLLGPNFVGVYNIYEAARRQGVGRVVFASSNHAIGFYPVEQRIGIDLPPRPDGYYGVGKAYGEAMGRLYHDKWGLEVACLRIGSFLERPGERRHLSTWISHGDMVRLVRACLDTVDLGYAVVYGTSAIAEPRRYWDNPDGDRIGYRPQDRAEDYAAEILAAPDPRPADDPARRFQGGFIAAIDYGKR